MKKRVLIVDEAFLIGCIETDMDEKLNDIKIIDYSVKTYERLKVKCCYENFLLGEGFLHGRYVYFYEINGKIKNFLDEKIDRLIINAIFLDINNTELFTESIELLNISNLSLEEFEIKIYSSRGNFNLVENIKFDLKIIED